MEWTVVTVIIAIVGLIGTVAVPLVKNTKAMTQLSGKIEHLIYRMEQEENDLNAFKAKAADKHGIIFDELNKHENTIINHEGRIYALEKNNKRRYDNE